MKLSNELQSIHAIICHDRMLLFRCTDIKEIREIQELLKKNMKDETELPFEFHCLEALLSKMCQNATNNYEKLFKDTEELLESPELMDDEKLLLDLLQTKHR